MAANDNMMWERTIKPVLKKTGLHIPVRKAQRFFQALCLKNKNPERIFTDIYKNNKWNGKESVSGQGSDLDETQKLLKELPELLSKYNVYTLIDLPCGDFNWMQHLDYAFESYTGIDIVADIIEANNQKFGNDKRCFIQKDCLKDDLGEADMLLCRDLLIHFSHDDVFQFLKNVKRANIRYLLTTHFLHEENQEIATGQWQPINLTAAPFNFPEPIEMIIEETKMFEGRYAQSKTMALWEISTL